MKPPSEEMSKTVSSEPPKCGYYGCPDLVANYDPTISGFQFCTSHDNEFKAIIQGPDAAKKMLGFWVRAQGGAQRAAKRALGEIGDNNP